MSAARRTIAAALLLALVVGGAAFGRTDGPRLGSPRASFRPLAALHDRVASFLAARLVEPPRPGEALSPQIRYEQPWNQALAFAVLALGIPLIIWLYRREGGAPLWYRMMLAGLRIALLLMLMVMLSEAVLVVERTGLPYFVLVADDSASASVVDQYEDPKQKQAAEALAKAAGAKEASRLAIAQGYVLQQDGALLKDLQKQHKVRLYLAANDARLLAEVDKPEQVVPAIDALRKVEPRGDQTRLGDAVRQILTELRGVPPTAILLLSDGETTDGEALAPAAELARRKGVPIYTLGLGDPSPAKDLELADLQVDEVVFVDDLVRFDARLLSKGFANEEVRVSLKELPAGTTDPKLGREIESARVVAPADGQPKRVELRHRPKQTGEITYVMEVETRPRELQADNNRIVRTINVREEKLKVLLIDGRPRYEYRYVKNLLERDPTISLAAVLQSADPEYSEQDRSALPTVPTAKEGPDGLFNYDVIILGDVDPSFLSSSQMQNIADFVTQKGGGLMFVAGEDFNPLSFKRTPLEPLLPIELTEARDPAAGGAGIKSFRPVPTAEGRAHPIFRFAEDEAASAQILKRLPPHQWYFEAPRKAPAAFVLAEHPEATGAEGKLPILLYQFAGAGKVMFSAVDDTWLWRFRMGDNGPFGRYWIQSIRFLARSKMLGQKQAEILTDRARYRRGQPVQIQVRFPNPGLAPRSGQVTVQLQRAGQGPRRLTLKASPGAKNVFEGALPGAEEGEYEVQLLPPPVLQGGLPSHKFKVEAPAGEFERVQMNEPVLRRAALASGGKFYTPAVASSLAADLPPPQKVPLDTDPPVALWNTWPVLAAFLLTLTAEWVLRKRKQMV